MIIIIMNMLLVLKDNFITNSWLGMVEWGPSIAVSCCLTTW